MKNASTHVKLLAVAIIWGVSWVAGKVVVQDFQPFTAGWVRYIIAVTCFLVFLRLSKQWITPNKDQWKIIIRILKILYSATINGKPTYRKRDY